MAVHFLFVKERMAWPRSSGHDVHSYYMMRTLASLGHDISLLTVDDPTPAAIAGLALTSLHSLSGVTGSEGSPLSGLRERFRSYWGVHPARIDAVGRIARDSRADVVVVVGLGVLPYLGAVSGAQRVWYAGDEWAWHHVSQLRIAEPATWSNLREAAVKGLYERAYGPLLDRIWVVSEADRRAMRRVAGTDRIDVIPNGIDGEHFRPIDRPEEVCSCVFWGRLDFGPNVQALQWFRRRVWPVLREGSPSARFTIYGFRPTGPILMMAKRDGVELVADLPDLRAEIASHQVVVLPFVSGGGIKNKLLEAASLGKPIVVSRHAANGLKGLGEAPLVIADSPRRWVESVLALWGDQARRMSLGETARNWVLDHHSWDTAARLALSSLTGVRRNGSP